MTSAKQNFIRKKNTVLIITQALFRSYLARKSLQKEENIEKIIRNLGWKYISLQSDIIKALYDRIEPFKFGNPFKFSTIKICTDDNDDVYIGEFNENNEYEVEELKF